VPLLAGGALELPLGVLAAGQPRRRRLAVLGGGLLFILCLAAIAGARSFAVLLCAFTAFYPASGAFVSLTQATLMDAEPDRQARVMARWDLAGSAGAVAGPLLLTAVLAAGGGWRVTYLILAGLAGLAWVGTCLRAPHPTAGAAAADLAGGAASADPTAAADPAAAAESRAPGDPAGQWGRELVAVLRNWPALRCLGLLVAADLLVDVLTGFLALYLVDVAHLRPGVAALAIAVRLGAALAGDAALVFALERGAVPEPAVLRISAAAAALLYPGFLLAPGLPAKLVILAALSAATAAWYPLLQARLYGRLAGRSSMAVTLSSAAGMAGGLGPLAVGMAAQWFGLPRALAALTVVPVVVLAGSAAWRGIRGDDSRSV
jgi:MFS transporter, FSR family, fosmidomycin resistance protein